MRRLLFTLATLVALVAAALPAAAATRYVAQTARGTGSGLDSSNAQSLVTFNANAQAGDVALLMGNFTTTPNPVNSGQLAAPIVFRSRSGNRNDVCLLNGLSIGGACDSNVTWRDLTIRGGVDFGTSHETARWQLRNVRIIDGGLGMRYARDCRFDSVNCTQTRPGAYLFSFINYSDSTTACRRDTLRNSSLSMTQADGSGSGAINLFSGYDNVYEAVRCSVTTTASAGTALRFARVAATNRGIMKDCYFVGQNNQAGGGNDEPMTFSFKDGVKLFKMYRDTIIIRGTSNVTAPFILLAQNETDGIAANRGEEIGGNTIRNCYIRNETSASWPIGWTYGGFDGDSVVGNTFVANANSVQSYYSRGDAVMATNTVVDHNLFVTFAHAAAFAMQNGTAQQGVAFTNNIFYCPNLTNSDTSSVAPVNFGVASNWGSAGVGPVGSNNNITWAPKVTTKRGVKWSGGTSAFGMNPWLSARSPAVLDAGSRTAPVMFVDTTLASFDGHPVAGSAALTGPLGYVGPFVLAGPGDVIPPGQVSNLSASNITPTGLTLAWTAPGDDGFTGTATAYDIRWSTVAIDDISFANATPVTGAPAPGAAGSIQSVPVSGLPAGTVCWFALKTRDEAGNWSLLSVPMSAQTVAADGTPPAAVTDLRTGL